MTSAELKAIRNKFIKENFGVDLDSLAGEEREKFFDANPDFWDKVREAMMKDPDMNMALRRNRWSDTQFTALSEDQKLSVYKKRAKKMLDEEKKKNNE